MRFNVNNADTVKRVCNKYYPFIRLSTKGATAICMDIVKELGLEQGDTVSFLQNKEEPKDWYLLFGDKNGFVLRGDKKSKSLFFNQTENSLDWFSYLYSAILRFGHAIRRWYRQISFFRNRSLRYPYQRLCLPDLRLLSWLVSGKDRDCTHPTNHFRRNP